MINELETYILGILQALFDSWGWLGVTGLMLFENATGITPSEIILGLAGWFLLSTHKQPFIMVFVGGLYAAIGSTIGASLTYWVSRVGGRPLVERIIRWFKIDSIHLERADRLFQQKGVWIVLFGRVIPGIRTLISIPAGLASLAFEKFVIATFVGAYIWCTLLISLGFFFGNEWAWFSQLFKQYATLFGAAILIVAAVGFLGRKWLQQRQAQREENSKTFLSEEIDEF